MSTTTPAIATELTLALPQGLPLRTGLVHAFETIVGYAKHIANDPAPSKASFRIYRKSLRRARALLVLCRPAMEPADYQNLKILLRDAHRETSTQRDKDMLIQLLSKKNIDIGNKAKPIAEALRKELKASRHTYNREERSLLLHKSIAIIEEVPSLFAQALYTDVSWAHITKGVARTYRSARRAMHLSIHSADIQHTHDWRKRTKELGHQLELLAAGHEGPVFQAQQTYTKVAKQLGQVTDHLALRVRLSESSICKSDAKILDQAVQLKIIALIGVPQSHGAQAFERKPKRLAQELVEHTQNRRNFPSDKI